MAKNGLNMVFVQDNQSMSVKGVLRGLHYQRNFPQGKLVRVIQGCVFDVAVDLRPGSKTYGNWYGVVLTAENKKQIVADLIEDGDVVVLVIPIDESAPKGRLILPQQQTIRDILDANCAVMCCQDTELTQTLSALAVKPKLVITDSQAFGRVSKDTPEGIMLTSFSILFARYKGDLEALVSGAAQLGKLTDGDKVLISEGCTHHRQCNDIGTVKMPGWIKNYSKSEPEFSFTSGGDFPEDLSEYKLIVHCGGCMLNEKEMQNRIGKAVSNGVPIVNYGIAIAHMNGILRRSIEIFPDILKLLD
jgi:[FeFe] hydrogenase H-cluster maturation GTPase HydF